MLRPVHQIESVVVHAGMSARQIDPDGVADQSAVEDIGVGVGRGALLLADEQMIHHGGAVVLVFQFVIVCESLRTQAIAY